MINVAELLSDPDFVQTIPVTSYAGAYNLDGVWEQTEAASTIVASIQPAGADNAVEFGLEGNDAKSYVKIYTVADLTEQDGETTNGDNVGWNGQQYTITASKRYKDFGYNYYLGECDGA